jgi:S1-C subfamily serine protease
MPTPLSLASSFKPSVCAIGYLKTSEDEFKADPTGSHLKLLGTGFLVTSTEVLTARHVISRVHAGLDKLGLPSDHARLLFHRANSDTITQHLPRFVVSGALDLTEMDVGIVRFEPPHARWHEETTPLPIHDDASVGVGDPIAVIGYPQGSLSLEREDRFGQRRLYRIGAVLQQGYVSAIAPSDSATYVDRYLLDVRTGPGMSGSPVIDLATGTVIGLNDAGLAAETAFAWPLSVARVRLLVDSLVGEPGTTRPVSVPIVRRTSRP